MVYYSSRSNTYISSSELHCPLISGWFFVVPSVQSYKCSTGKKQGTIMQTLTLQAEQAAVTQLRETLYPLKIGHSALMLDTDKSVLCLSVDRKTMSNKPDLGLNGIFMLQSRFKKRMQTTEIIFSAVPSITDSLFVLKVASFRVFANVFNFKFVQIFFFFFLTTTFILHCISVAKISIFPLSTAN